MMTYSTRCWTAVIVAALFAPPATAGPIGSAMTQSMGHLSPADLAILRASARHSSLPAAIEAAGRAGVIVDIANHFQSVPQVFSNAAIYYIKLAQDDRFVVDKDEKSALVLIDKASPNGDDWDKASRFLDSHQGLMEMAHGATSYETYIVPRDDDGTEPISWPQPELASCRRVARLLTLESLVLAHSGKYGDAVKNQELCYRVGDHASMDITLLSYLVAIAVDHIALHGMQSILRISKGEPTVARDIETSTALQCHPRLMSSALKAEDAQMIAQVEFWRQEGAARFTQEYGSSTAQLLPDPTTFKAMIDAMGARLVEDETAMVAIADQPYPAASKGMKAITVRAVNAKTFDFTLARFILPVLGPTKDLITADTAQASVTRAACAIFLYKSKHGMYPSTLADATSTATDPFDGKVLGYRREAKGFVVYSVGPTGKYDGGDFYNKKQHEEVFRYSNNGQ